MHTRSATILGTGNVAWHLGKALKKGGIRIKQVYGRDPAKADKLANKLSAEAIYEPGDLAPVSDVCFLAVSDDAIGTMAGQIKTGFGLTVHMAGSISLEVLEKHAPSIGVFYPLQTFTRGRKMKYKDIPVFIEALNKNSERRLTDLAIKIMGRAIRMDSEDRKQLHLAAIICNNFSNYMFLLAEQFMRKKKQDAGWLHPLMRETVAKAMDMGAWKAQTGPARRKDDRVIKRHLEILKDVPEYRKIYTFVSEHIKAIYSQ